MKVEIQNNRVRSSAISITTKTKERMSKDVGYIGFMEDDSKKDKFTNYLENKFCNNIKKDSSNTFIEFPIPQYTGKFDTNTKIEIAESAKLVELDTNIKYIEKEPCKVDFKYLINQFDENTIENFEIQDLLKYDFEQVNAIKEKLNELIDKTSLLVNSSVENQEENRRRNQILAFLCSKLNVSYYILILKYIYNRKLRTMRNRSKSLLIISKKLRNWVLKIV